MTAEKAIEIIESYHDSIKDLRPEAIVQSNNKLRYSGGIIKYAHFVLIENMIQAGALTDEIAHDYIESYSILDSLFVEPEEVESINSQYREYINGLKNGIITNFKVPNCAGDPHTDLEFQEFINEYLWRLGKQKIGGFSRATMIEITTEKCIEEKNIKYLLKLATEAEIPFSKKGK